MFNTYFAKATGRIIVAMFASNVHRIQQVLTRRYDGDRYVVLNGRSMVNIANLARDLGELEIPRAG
jgi:ribonuclease J